MSKPENNPHANHRMRMRERYERGGLDVFMEHEVLEVYLFRCLRRVNTNDIAHNLLTACRSLSGVFNVHNAGCYKGIAGIGEKTAFVLQETAGEMEKIILQMIRNKPEYDADRAMVFARYTLNRIPQGHILVLLYNSDGCFRQYADVPVPENDIAAWIPTLLAVTKPGDQIYIWFRGDGVFDAADGLQIAFGIRKYYRKLKSIRRMSDAGAVTVIYE